MSTSTLPALTLDEIDDLLYFTRANEKDDLQQTISEVAEKYGCSKETVLEAGVDPESKNSTLHYCAANGLADLLPSLLQHVSKPPQANGTSTPSLDDSPTAFINRQNAQGNTPLHWASLNGHLAVVKLLVEAGADMWVKNSAGHLAMFEAERADKGEVVQYLLEAGGKEIEKGATEGRPREEEEDEIDAEEAQDGGSSIAISSGADTVMEEAGPS